MATSGPTLSLCMIVRDEEEMLPECLESASEVADEIVVVDTGSVDKTPEIVQARHGLLLQRSWHDDFSEARNVSLDAATGQWILWMDADERLRPGEHACIRRTIQSASHDAFLVPIRSDTPTGGHVTWAHRLFRNHKGIRFSGRIHEQISLALTRIGARVGAADFTIDHLGYNLSPERLKGKNERNLQLLNAAKRQDPRDAYVRFCLGQTLMLMGDAAAAEKEIGAALGETQSNPISRPLPEDIRAAACNNLAQCALDRGSPEEALRRCAESLDACRHQVTAHLVAYRAYQGLGQEEKALLELSAADRLLDEKPAAGRSAIEVTVDRGDLWRAMGNSQLQLGQVAQARQNLERALVTGSRRPGTLAALSRCAIAENALDEALRLAHQASALVPQDDSLVDLISFILLKQGKFSEAADRLCELAARRPDDRVLRRRLAGVLVKAGRAHEAATAVANLDARKPVCL